MKSLFLLAGSCFLFLQTIAQTAVKIFVRLNEESGLYVNDVSIKVLSPKLYSWERTDDGEYTIKLPDNTAGDDVQIDVIKNGFEVVNREKLNITIPRNKEKFHTILICKQNARNYWASKCYGTSKNNVNANVGSNPNITNSTYYHYEFKEFPFLSKSESNVISNSLLEGLRNGRLVKSTVPFNAESEEVEDTVLFSDGIDAIKTQEKNVLIRKKRFVEDCSNAGMRAMHELKFDSAIYHFKKAYDIDNTNIDMLENAIMGLDIFDKDDELAAWLEYADSITNSDMVQQLNLILLRSNYAIDKKELNKALEFCDQLKWVTGDSRCSLYINLGYYFSKVDDSMAIRCYEKADSLVGENYGLKALIYSNLAKVLPANKGEKYIDSLYIKSFVYSQIPCTMGMAGTTIKNDYFYHFYDYGKYVLRKDTAAGLQLLMSYCNELVTAINNNSSQLSKLSLLDDFFDCLEYFNDFPEYEIQKIKKWLVVIAKKLPVNSPENASIKAGINLFIGINLSAHEKKTNLPLLAKEYITNFKKAAESTKIYQLVLCVLFDNFSGTKDFLSASIGHFEKTADQSEYFLFAYLISKYDAELSTEFKKDSLKYNALLTNLSNFYVRSLNDAYLNLDNLFFRAIAIDIMDIIVSGKSKVQKPEDALACALYNYNYFYKQLNDTLTEKSILCFTTLGVNYLCKAYISAGKLDSVDLMLDNIMANYITKIQSNNECQELIYSIMANSFESIAENIKDMDDKKYSNEFKKQQIDKLLQRMRFCKKILLAAGINPIQKNILNKKEESIGKLLK